MLAAKTNNIEAVDLLLEKNADPNDADENGFTALTYAIIAGNVETIKKLLLKTERNLKTSLEKLAETTITNEFIQKGVKKMLINDRKLFKIFADASSFFGNSIWLQWLLYTDTFTKFIPDLIIKKIFENVIKSDNPEACKVVMSKFSTFVIDEELKELALDRGKRKVLEALNIEIPVLVTFSHSDNVYNILIKSEEFSYVNNILRMKKKWFNSHGSNISIPLDELLQEMKAPTVHYEDDSKKSFTSCPENCIQKRKCLRVRQTGKLVKAVVARMPEIFQNASLIVVGSMKEDTKVGDIDECDMTLIMPDTYKNLFEFDETKQALVTTTDDIPDMFKDYVKYGTFDCTLYFETFLKEFHRILTSGQIELPDGLNLSTTFTPCEICQLQDDVVPQNVRCRHEINCPDHMRRKENPHHVETCDCKVFNSPCISYSKIGIVLHLQYEEPDGSFLNLDVDVSPPSLPVKNIDKYNGSNKDRLQNPMKISHPEIYFNKTKCLIDMIASFMVSDGKMAHTLKTMLSKKYTSLDFNYVTMTQ